MDCQLPERIETARLVLRPPVPADAPLIFDAYAQDPEVAHYMVWQPHTALSKTESFISACIRDWVAGTSLAYVIVLPGNESQPIGMLDARLEGHMIDFGYVLARRWWRNGYMPEAVRTMADTALALPRYFRVQASCDVDNIASARTLEKAGFIREARLERHIVHPNISPDPRPSFLFARWR